MPKGITLKDIAEKTGFTINTVSRALQGKNDISEATKRLIRNTANELGYIGNTLAGSLRSGTSKTIAVILGDISNPYFSIITKEIERKANSYGYCVMILNTEEDDQLEHDAIHSVLSKKVDGIIISPCQRQKSINNIDFLKKSRVPFVLLGRHFDDTGMNYVVCDDINGGNIATQHLIDKGHKNILFLNGPNFLSPAAERYTGYRKALDCNNIPLREELVKETTVIIGNSSNDIEQSINGKLEFSAILAFSDLIAFETICILQRLAKKVPRDISIIGFDNIQSNFVIPYPLTSVDTSKVEIAHNAFSILLNNIEAGESEYCNTVIRNKLVDRGSTRQII